MSANDPPSLSAMTAEQQARLLTRQAVRSEDGVDIGGPDRVRNLRRRVVRVLAGVAVFLLAAWACEQFAGSFRIALIVVGFVAAVMVTLGRVTEGRADRID